MNKTYFEVQLTAFLIGVAAVLASWWIYLLGNEVVVHLTQDTRAAIEYAVFLCIGIVLFYGSFVYFLTRYGRLCRTKTAVSHPVSAVLDQFFYADKDVQPPMLTVLIPSYKEELRVVEMTLLSAALQEYPQKNIVLLLDDPVSYTDPDDQAILEQTRMLPGKLTAQLQEVQAYVVQQHAAFQDRQQSGHWDVDQEIAEIASVFAYKEQWFEEQAAAFAAKNHAEHFFVSLKFIGGRDRMRLIKETLYALRDGNTEEVTKEYIAQYYRKALSTFGVSISFFQRKRYQNLSHEPNKAMNINSYIGLLGGSWREYQEDGLLYIGLAKQGQTDFIVPSAEYVITLDADSMLDASYARRLIYCMEQPAWSQVAVIQTPYNTFRCPFIDLERVAGATTDIQHNVHQGFEYFGASFWVGANALLRYRALSDIKEEDIERGFPITRYIQDRTVIEDTESSIDLLVKGWRVCNYDAQLAYSATPPDFGSLIIQRRRWANGGIIIFPKLLRYIVAGTTPLRSRLLESFVRAHYLISTALVSVGVLVMILYPFSGSLHIGPLVTVSFLYFGLYARDLI